jgi:hypothetical protein
MPQVNNKKLREKRNEKGKKLYKESLKTVININPQNDHYIEISQI